MSKALVSSGKLQVYIFIGLLRIHLISFEKDFACDLCPNIPKRCRMVKVIYVPKAGKRYEASPKSLRHISLTPFLLEAMEKIVGRQSRD